jgi:hypothetical protein
VINTCWLQSSNEAARAMLEFTTLRCSCSSAPSRHEDMGAEVECTCTEQSESV